MSDIPILQTSYFGWIPKISPSLPLEMPHGFFEMSQFTGDLEGVFKECKVKKYKNIENLKEECEYFFRNTVCQHIGDATHFYGKVVPSDKKKSPPHIYVAIFGISDKEDFTPQKVMIFHLERKCESKPIYLLLSADVKLNKKTGIVKMEIGVNYLMDHIKKHEDVSDPTYKTIPSQNTEQSTYTNVVSKTIAISANFDLNNVLTLSAIGSCDLPPKIMIETESCVLTSDLDYTYDAKTGKIELLKTITGTIMLNETETLEKKLMHNAYHIVKEGYHKHTHHSNGKNCADCLIECFKGTYSDALMNILTQFRKMIVTQINGISDGIEKDRKTKYILDAGKLATGIFNYGKTYVRVIGDEFKKCRLNVDCAEEGDNFDNAVKSVEHLVSQRISAKSLLYSLTMRMSAILIMLITIATLVLVNSTSVVAVLPIKDNLEGATDAVRLWMLLFDSILFLALTYINAVGLKNRY